MKPIFWPVSSSSHIARRATGAVGEIGEGVLFGQLRAQVLQRPVLAEPVFVAEIAHRHDLDKGQVHVAAQRTIR